MDKKYDDIFKSLSYNSGYDGPDAGIFKVTFSTADNGAGARKFVKAVVSLQKNAQAAAAVFARQSVLAWRNRMRELAPKDTGKLAENLEVTATGGPFSWVAKPDASVPYAVWVARGTLGSPTAGKTFYAADYGKKAFFSVRPGAHGLFRPISKFTWQGQKSQPFDEQGLEAARSQGYFKAAAQEAAETLFRGLS